MAKNYAMIKYAISRHLKIVTPYIVKLFFLIAGFFGSLLPVMASDSEEAPILNGELYILGGIVLSSCSLDFESQYQDIDLGSIDVNRLKTFGAQSQAVSFHIEILKCVYAYNEIEKHQYNYMDPVQPTIKIKFMGQTHQDNSQLLKVNGVTGVGLRLYDNRDRSITFGETLTPQFLGGVHHRLQYRVVLERTLEELTTGSYFANLHFLLLYE